jgi:hypothetical protein
VMFRIGLASSSALELIVFKNVIASSFASVTFGEQSDQRLRVTCDGLQLPPLLSASCLI